MLKIARLMRGHKDDVVHCGIELVTHPGMSGRYLVNLRHGHLNEEWRETTLTPQLVLLADATALFQQTFAQCLAQVFTDLDATPLPPAAQQPLITRTLTEADKVMLLRLEKSSWKNCRSTSATVRCGASVNGAGTRQYPRWST
jgi:hypothetical protein